MNRRFSFLVFIFLLSGCTASSFSNSPANNASLGGGSGAPSQFQLAWTPTCTDQNGFRIEQSQDNISYTQIAQVASTVTSIPLKGVASGQTYYYRVAAFNSAGTSSWSQTLMAKIP